MILLIPESPGKTRSIDGIDTGMISRNAKATFYFMCGPLMRFNGALYRTFRAPSSGTVKVHLGPGQKKYLDGWINVDANFVTAKKDVWADLRYPLPFKDSTVDVIYSHHMIEHLPDVWGHFKEMHRVLKPGGVFRVGCPNGHSAMHKYVQNDIGWFEDYPDVRKTIGGKFENFIFCRREHLTILTPSFLTEVAEHAGLSDIKVCQPVKETNYPQFIDSNLLSKEFESDYEWPHTLIIEGVKK